MAPKKPTMLQRQRALRNQQQQNKQQASKQIPPKGQTSANSRQARGQRASTAKAQAANQQRVIARGMEGFVRRGQAMDKLDKAAKGTQGSGTRTAGAGGGIVKRQSSAVSTRQSGKPTTIGGRVQQSTGGGASSNRVQPVRVRDLGTTKPQQVTGGGTRALPPGRNGGALTRVTNAASSAARNLPKAGRALTGLKGGVLGAALSLGGSAAIDAGIGAYKQAIRKERGQRAAESGQSGRYVPGSQQSRGGMGGVGNISPSEGPRNNPNFGKPAAKAPTRPSQSRPSQSTPSRSTASGSGSQRSTASRPSPTSTPRTAGTATTVSRPEQTRPAEKQPSMGREVFDRSGKGTLGPNYGIDQFGDKNGIDMERRRAFLDAKDSQEGRKAINKLMEERRKKQRQGDSTSK